MDNLEINKRIAEIEGLEGNHSTKALYNPVENWAQGGPLIEKYEVLLDIVTVNEEKFWQAMRFNGCTVSIKVADTLLKAVMLAIIAGHNQGS